MQISHRKEGLAHSIQMTPFCKSETGEAVMLEETMGHTAVKEDQTAICIMRTVYFSGPTEIIEITSKTSCDSADGHSLLNRTKLTLQGEQSRSVSASFPIRSGDILIN